MTDLVKCPQCGIPVPPADLVFVADQNRSICSDCLSTTKTVLRPGKGSSGVQAVVPPKKPGSA
jgi:NMD protein affecting ribosome stability and mRNA decay